MKFKVVKGLAENEKDTVSLETTKIFNGFVKHGNNTVMIAKGGSDDFNLDASFKVTEVGSAVQLESVNPLFPNKFISLKDNVVGLSQDGST